MKDYKRLISEYESLNARIREALLPEIKQFVTNRGKASITKKIKDISLSFDPDIEDVSDDLIPYVNVETDRHTGDTGWEKIESLTLSKETDTLYIETNSNTVTEHEITTSEVIAIYDSLKALEDGELNDDVEIVDGRIQLKEE